MNNENALSLRLCFEAVFKLLLRCFHQQPGNAILQLAIRSFHFFGGDNTMATFVLVHGAFGGGWQWREIAALLRAAGHEVFTPTLTGLGERVHLAQPEIDLDTHVQDILMVLEYEALHEVILVGHSYGGMVITGVAELAAERLVQLVYLDAFVPRDGESLAALAGPEITAVMVQAAQAYGDGWRIPHDPPEPPWTPQPLKTGLQPVTMVNPAAALLPRTFIYCNQEKDAMGPMGIPITQAAVRARSDARWRYHELNTGHLPMETAPGELVTVLIELAQ